MTLSACLTLKLYKSVPIISDQTVQQEHLDFFRLVGEQILDKDAFMRDQVTTRDNECEEEDRVAAENKSRSV